MRERIPTGTYRAISAINWSSAKNMIYARDRRTRKLVLSPLHYKAAREGVDKDSDAKRFGRAVHCAVLEPDRFTDRFIPYRESKSKGEGARLAWEAFQAEEARRPNPRTILSGAVFDTATQIGERMRGQIKGHPKARELLERGEPEVVRQWVDKETGLLCKGRLDWIFAPCVILDVKTDGRTIEEAAFNAHGEHMYYYHQFAFYRRGQAAHIGKSIDMITFYVIAIEADFPNAIAVREVTPASLDSADEEVGEVLRKIAECRKAEEAGHPDPWPGPYQGVGEMVRPSWALPEIEGGFTIIQGSES